MDVLKNMETNFLLIPSMIFKVVIPPINVCMTAALIGGDKFFEEILKFSPRGTYSGGAVCYTHSGGWWKKNKKIFVLEGFLRWM